jgi:phage protein D
VEFNDAEHGRPDDIRLILHDGEDLWKAGLYPKRGDIIKLKMGWLDGDILDCGEFMLDTFRGHTEPMQHGDFVTVQAHSAFVKTQMRQRNSEVNERTSLSALVKKIAGRHGCKGEFEGEDVRFDTLTQWQESDIEFLTRLAEQYGFVFKIAERKFIFYALEIIESRASVATIKREDVRFYELEDTTDGEANIARAVGYDVMRSKLYESTRKAKKSTSLDEARWYRRFENAAQSERTAVGAMRRSEFRRVQGRITVVGNPLLQAGVNLTLQDFKRFNGQYYVEQCTHRIRANNVKSEFYETICTVRKIQD